MRFLKTAPGAGLLALSLIAAVATGAVAVRVYAATHPPRESSDVSVLTHAVVTVEELDLSAADGVRLAAWWIPGEADAPFVVLCHDAGRSKGSLLELAVLLQSRGFNLLLFDFRGHGASSGEGSTLGSSEKRDVIGAVDYLKALDGTRPIGGYGIGMGAHALVLAAAERDELEVLVLDALYPEPGFALARHVYGNWSFGRRWLAFLPRAVYSVMHLAQLDKHSARELVPVLVGRELLLLAPADDVALTREIEAMYGGIPEQRDADGNFVTLPAAGEATLYGEARQLHRQRVSSFLEGRMGYVPAPRLVVAEAGALPR